MHLNFKIFVIVVIIIVCVALCSSSALDVLTITALFANILVINSHICESMSSLLADDEPKQSAKVNPIITREIAPVAVEPIKPISAEYVPNYQSPNFMGNNYDSWDKYRVIDYDRMQRNQLTKSGYVDNSYNIDSSNVYLAGRRNRLRSTRIAQTQFNKNYLKVHLEPEFAANESKQWWGNNDL